MVAGIWLLILVLSMNLFAAEEPGKWALKEFFRVAEYAGEAEMMIIRGDRIVNFQEEEKR